MSFFSSQHPRSPEPRHSHRRRNGNHRRRSLRVESLETRQLLAADIGVGDPIAPLSDEFTDTASIAAWQRVNVVEGWNVDQLQQWDVDQTQPGRMTMIPETVVWYGNWRGPMVFKEVTGDFVFTTQVHITDRDDVGGSDADDVPGDGQYSLGGVMIRTPRDITDPAVDWTPGSLADDGTNNGENYVFLSLGYGAGGNEFSLEVKTTRNSNSQLELTPLGQDANVINVQTARVGTDVFTLFQRPGEEWQVHRRYSRPDMPETLQVGLVTYTDWDKANDFDPFTHNSSVLTADGFDPTPGQPFNPDLVAGFEYARYVRPDVPAALDGINLRTEATDEQLLTFLGEASNLAPGIEPGSAPVLSAIDDQTMPRSQDTIVVELAASDADGDALAFSASLVQPATYQLDQEHGFTTGVNYFQNWGGLQERWIRDSEGGWFYLLPEGALHQWQGGFASSPLIANLGPEVYDDPTRLTEAQPIAASVDVVDNVVTIDPSPEFAGSFEVEASVSDGSESDSRTFLVTVTNQAPELMVIADQVMAADQINLEVALDASDTDGDDLALTAEVIDEAYALDQSLGLTTNENYYQNWGGLQERWIRDTNGRWLYLLPTGDFYRWQGSFEDSELLASLDVSFYEDPTRLANAQPIAVTANVAGNVLVLQRDIALTGQFRVRVTASDGADSASRLFTVIIEE